MKKFISNKYTLFFLGIIFVIGLWFIASLLFDRNGAIFPSPVLTMQSFGVVLSKSQTYISLGYTFLRMIIGFAISFVLALVLGIIAGNYPSFYTFLKPLMVVLKSIPTVAFVFVFVVMINAREAPIFVVLIICFPILYEAVVGGVKNVEKDIIDASKVDGSSSLKSAFYIKLPLAVPYIVVGVVSSFALSFKIAIMAEVITGSTKNGLGSAIHYAYSQAEMTDVFAYALLVVIFMLLVTLLEDVVKQIMKKKGVIVANNN